MNINAKVIHWLPRSICILAILFISLFALDAFNTEKTIWQQLGDFLIHLIPSLVLIGCLIIAWKHEFIGGIFFTCIGLVASPFIFIHNYNMNQSVWKSILIILMISIPFLLVGILFLVSHRVKKRKQSSLTKH